MIIAAIHMREHPSKIKRVLNYAAMASLYNQQFYYFSPSKVNLKKKVIAGYYYDNGWKQKEFPFPDVIINMSSPATTKQNDIFYDLSEIIPFTEESIGDKEAIYKILNNRLEFKQYLPHTEKFSNFEQLAKINENKKIVLKPSSGCQGEGIYFLEKKSNLNFLKEIDLSDYIVQQYINSVTVQGYLMDFRIHTQKNEFGEYVLTAIFPRITTAKNDVTNYSQGGYSTNINTFLENNFGNTAEIVFNKLKLLGIQISNSLNDYYDNELNELGIDVGIENNNIYLYEVNWRPGSPIFFSGEVTQSEYLIQYAIYLAKQKDCK